MYQTTHFHYRLYDVNLRSLALAIIDVSRFQFQYLIDTPIVTVGRLIVLSPYRNDN